MTIALARVRGEPVLTQRLPTAPSRESILRKLARGVKAVPPRFYPGALLSCVLVGIAINALLLQRQRHPAPFFRPPRPTVSSAAPAPAARLPSPSPTAEREPSAPAAPLPPPSRTAEREAPAPAASPASPPVRPAEAGDGGSSSRGEDPITDLLREEAHADATRLTLAAQNALVKLGYSVKPDGNDGAATQQALREFERAHGLPPSTQITPKLVKQMGLAARAAER